MKYPKKVDVLVVGAGPAGTSAAREAASAGARTLVLEKKAVIGEPVRCGEYIPRMLLMELPLLSRCVVQQTSALVAHLPSGEEFRRAAPGAVLDRALFDQTLADRAREAGAEILTRTPCRRIDGGAARLADGSSIRARILIGADGPASWIARAAGLGNPELMLARQHVVKLQRRVEQAHLYFWSTALWGYGWLFPKQDVANVGVAVKWRRPDLARRAMQELTERLIEDKTIASGAPLSRCSGLVPSSGPLPSIATGNVLLAGDAAGHVDALTGAGIAGAVRCGAVAGQHAAKGVASTPGSDYESAIDEVMGGFLSRSVQRRDILREGWDDDLEQSVRKAWRTG